MTENYYKDNNIGSEYSGTPEYMRWQMAAEEVRQGVIARKVPFFAKWMWILFLMVIPDSIVAILTLDFVIERLPWMQLIGGLLGLVCSVVSGLILIKMSEKEHQYQIAGVFMIITSVINTATEVFRVPESWAFFIALPTLFLGFFATYNEFMAHASAMSGIDDVMAEKWRNLWKWFVRTFLCSLGSVLLILMMPLVGLVAFLGSTIGVVVVSIGKLVYLYRSAKICRGYPL